MPELFQALVIRPAQALSPAKIDKFGHTTHPEHLTSGRYKEWCKVDNYETLIQSLQAFLKEDEIIRRTDQIQSLLRRPIEYAEYHGFDFDINDFKKQISYEKVIKEFGGPKFIENHRVCSNSSYSIIRKNLSDQLIARTKLNKWDDLQFDLRNAIKTFDLIAIVLKKFRREKIQIDVEKYYLTPFILSDCIFNLDPCNNNTSKVVNPESNLVRAVVSAQSNIEDEDKCPCQTFKNKFENCDCPEEESEDCDCKCDKICIEQNPCCAKIEPYVAELFIVKDEVSTYEPGEMSYIENVMKSELRTRKHRHLQREELYTEQEESSSTYEERDQQTEEQFSLHKEIDKIVNQDLSVDAGASFSSGTKVKQFRTHLKTNYKLAKIDARKLVQDESKKILNRALTRVEKKIRSLSTVKRINEIEENTEHSFDNVGDNKNDISRQFYFVNQVRKAQVYSYGTRMFLDFHIPEPAELLKRLLEKKFKLKKPKKPCLSLNDIQTEDYLKYVECFDFYDLEKPKEQPEVEWIDRTYVEDVSGKHTVVEKQISIPPGYTATHIEMSPPKLTKRFGATHHRLRITFGSGMIQDSEGKDKTDIYLDEIDVTGTQALKLIGLALDKFQVSIRIKLTPDPVDNTDWKVGIYNRINDAYEKELAAYESALAEFERNKQTKYNQNPFLLSETIKEQLKHQAINYISCQFFDENNAMKNKVKPCGYPQMDIQETHKEGEIVRFFEQAFEWKFMSYMLYPYFWGRNCTWEDKLQEESQNGLFLKFLQSGFARVSLSVRPGFESHVSSYLQNRYISPFNIPDISNEAVPIHQEIKESKENFNADRAGYLVWDNLAITTLGKHQILLRDNTDYYQKDSVGDVVFHPTTNKPIFNTSLTEIDINREISIDCIVYRIVSIKEIEGEIVINLDRELELRCKGDKIFKEVYNENIPYPWSTGALYVGAPWMFKVPTSLVWLREEKGCFPCYPIKCETKKIENELQ